MMIFRLAPINSRTRLVRFCSSSANDMVGTTKLGRRYQRKTHHEHVYMRPGMYIGNIHQVTEEQYVFKNKAMRIEEVQYVPGLVKLFDEILVNAVDNVQRCKKTSEIRVYLSLYENKFTIWNNGSGIPVAIHPEENIWVPQLIFGNLLTGSNFDDAQKQYTGGRYGLGAKLTNIFSTYFKVSTYDDARKRFFSMEWTDNMKNCNKPVTENTMSISEDFTEVTYVPDLSIFTWKNKKTPKTVGRGTLDIMKRRVYDVAGILGERGVKVYLDDTLINLGSFDRYSKLFGVDEKRAVRLSQENRDLILTSNENGLRNVSFVNGVATSRGGTHVDLVVDQVARHIAELASKRSKEKVRLKLVKRQMLAFVNCRIPNPEFDSQMKDRLSTRMDTLKFPALPKKFLDDVVKKTDILPNVLAEITHRSSAALSRKTRRGTSRQRLLGIPKLDDANNAATKRSSQCTLIVTEGDSAKALAVAGVSVVGRDNYGIFPLRGKVLNVRDATVMQIENNNEIIQLTRILGLQFGKKYNTDKSLRSLRYGKLMLMTDQDYDGSHIKGLIINLLHFFWPELLKRKGFLQEFVTPVIKARKGKDKQDFFTISEFETWYDMLPDTEAKKWDIKYYKGLGTSTSTEAREYFGNLGKHVLDFQWEEPSSSDLIDMAFRRNRAEERKAWITGMLRRRERGQQDHIDHSAESLTMPEFINNELVLFSEHAAVRSIPSMIDGLKPAQRKVLFSAFKRNLTSEVKVLQLAGYCAEQTAYHHGETSLHSTIVNMAQDFVGSQNLPLLKPNGMFGTRLQGGKDAASPRYIFTKLQRYTRQIYPQVDDVILTYNVDDGTEVEPVTYLPIIPMILVNGASGIGTGWSTNVPAHNPLDIIAYLESRLQGKQPDVKLKPWTNYFKGTIEGKGDKYSSGFHVRGKLEVKGKTVMKVTELPVGRWTEDFKSYLDGLEEGGKIKYFIDHSTDKEVLFEVHGSSEQISELSKPGGMPPLMNTFGCGNMHMYDTKGVIKMYSSPEDVLEEFYHYRLDKYRKRKDLLVKTLSGDVEGLQNQVRFTRLVAEGELSVVGKTQGELLKEMQVEHQLSNTEKLLDIPFSKFSVDQVKKLAKACQSKEKSLADLKKTSPEALWLSELQTLKATLVEMQQERVQQEREEEVAEKPKLKQPRKR